MSSFILKGKIITKSAIETRGSNGFRVRTFVLETYDNPDYPQQVQLELHQDKTKLPAIVSAMEGDILTAYFNLRGRSWVSPQGETKYFNSLVCWKLEASNEQAVHQPPTQQPRPQAQAQPHIPVAEVVDDHNDLPF